MKHLDVSFAPHDRLNPGFGYQLTILDAETGATLLSTSKDPRTGAELLSPESCLAVVDYFRNAVFVAQKKAEIIAAAVPTDAPQHAGPSYIAFRPMLNDNSEYEYEAEAFAPGELEQAYSAEDIAEDLRRDPADGERFVREIDWTAERCHRFNAGAREYWAGVYDALNKTVFAAKAEGRS